MADRPEAPRFETLDGCPLVRSMKVNSRKPAVRLSTVEPIERYDWQLWQAGEMIDSGAAVTTGITDGTCIEFVPSVALRKGPPSHWKLPDGLFYPPFAARRTYRTETYRNHTDFSVDFNSVDGDDEGHVVRAPAPGEVAHRLFRAPGTNGEDDKGQSDLLIQHPGDIATLYTHMRAIPAALQLGAEVKLGQRLGRISMVGEASGPHLHHGHYRRKPGPGGFGQPIKMRIRGEAMDASVGDSDHGHPPDWPGVFGQKVRGVPLRPFFKVRVWGADALPGMRPSPWRRRTFVVTTPDDEVPDCIDPGCAESPIG